MKRNETEKGSNEKKKGGETAKKTGEKLLWRRREIQTYYDRAFAHEDGKQRTEIQDENNGMDRDGHPFVLSYPAGAGGGKV